MKKFVFILIVLVAAAAGFDYWQNHSRNSNRQLVSTSAVDVNTDEPKKEVSAPGPLRAKDSAGQAYLTRVGTINQTNAQRAENGLQALKENSLLDQAALAKVKDMFAGQYFEHISPTGLGPADLAKSANYEYIAVGENLALGNFKDDAALVLAWMNSPGHRANILNGKYQEIGVAVMEGEFQGQKTWLAVQEFGRPLASCPSVNRALKAQMEAYKQDLSQLKPQIDELKNYLQSANPQTKEETDYYNQKVAEYNDLVKSYNNKVDWLKGMTEEYNASVRAYNDCLGS